MQCFILINLPSGHLFKKSSQHDFIFPSLILSKVQFSKSSTCRTNSTHLKVSRCWLWQCRLPELYVMVCACCQDLPAKIGTTAGMHLELASGTSMMKTYAPCAGSMARPQCNAQNYERKLHAPISIDVTPCRVAAVAAYLTHLGVACRGHAGIKRAAVKLLQTTARDTSRTAI